MRVSAFEAQKTAVHQRNDPKPPRAEASTETPPSTGGSRPRVWPYPGASKTLDRPYAAISGLRHVPVLVNANRVPFLRFKKPQSAFVSRIIRDTVKARERRAILSLKLNDQIPVADAEDEWDYLLFNDFGVVDGDPGTTWSSEVQRAHKENHTLQLRAVQKRTEIASQMHEIVEKEKLLATEGKARIQDEKHKRRKCLRLARQGRTTMAAPVAKSIT